jgi:streptogramin lyase
VLRTDSELWFSLPKSNLIDKLTFNESQNDQRTVGNSQGITKDQSRNIWFTVYSAKDKNQIGIYEVPMGVWNVSVTGTPKPILPMVTGPTKIIAGPHNSLWFIEPDFNRIGHLLINTDGPYLLPDITISSLKTNGNIAGITVGSQDSIWFTEKTANKIGEITANGSVLEFPNSQNPQDHSGIRWQYVVY